MPYTNECCAIVRTKSGLAAIFSDKTGVISMRAHDGVKWNATEKVADGVAGQISVNISDDGELFVFSQDSHGNIILYHFNGTAWKKQLIQENLTNTVYNLKIHAIVKKESIHLLYNIPSKATDESRYNIVSQEMSGGKWFPYISVAENVAAGDPVFFVQNIADDHYAVYYQTGSMENLFGYRELILPDKWSGFTTLHQTLHSFSDKSIVTTKEGIHIAFILRGAYSSQLLYKNKLGTDVSPPAVLFEANRVDEVSLFLHERNVYIIFSAGGYGFFSCVSKDCGKTFSRPMRLRTAGYSRLIKTEYVCGKPQTPEAAFFDIFSDAEQPGAAPFLEEIYKDYYSSGTTRHNTSTADVLASFESAAERPLPVNQSNSEKLKIEVNEDGRVRKAYSGDSGLIARAGSESRELSELKELLSERAGKFAIIQNKLEGSYREIADKNRQIMELNSIISKKNEETANVAESYRETIRRLREDFEEKSREIAEMEQRVAEAEKSARQEVDESVAKTEGYRETISSLKEEIEEKNRVIAEMSMRVSEVEKSARQETNEAASKAEGYRETISSLTEEVREKNRVISEMSVYIAEAEKSDGQEADVSAAKA